MVTGGGFGHRMMGGRLARALMLVARDAWGDVCLALCTGACAAVLRRASEDVDRVAGGGVARAEGVPAACVGAAYVYALWGGAPGQAGREGRALCLREVMGKDVNGDVSAAALRGERGGWMERGLDQRAKAVDMVIMAARDENPIVVLGRDPQLAGRALGSCTVGVCQREGLCFEREGRTERRGRRQTWVTVTPTAGLKHFLYGRLLRWPPSMDSC